MTAAFPVVLNVDDQDISRYAKTRILKEAGFTVLEAQSGYQALRLVADVRPPVVLLDMQLPDIDGNEVCRRIKSTWPEVMVLQTSATFVRGMDRTRGLESGADAYLVQPAEPAELAASIRALLRVRAAEDELRRLNDTLELRVAERTRELAEANDNLKKEIAQREKAETALVQAQKMEAIGHLTGGIAHDFNNLLAAVVGNLDLIRASAPDARISRLASNAFKAAQRGAKLTAQLLAFSRTQKLIVKSTDVNAVIEGMSELLKQSLGLSIVIRLELAPGLASALTDSNQLELAVLNLALNARDAITGTDAGAGTVTITTAEETLPVAEGARRAGDYIAITISDDGGGMPGEIAARAFDPFFTTKPPGKGTGLGLAQVYGIARQCNGDARIVSHAGFGTSVTLWLPRAREQASVPAPVDETLMAGGHSGEILLVDDDSDVRALIVDVLTGIGYDVVTATGGKEALLRLSERTPQLLVVDFAMPGMNGAEVARAARQHIPDLPVLFLSGHVDTGALTAAVESAALLRKPFRPVELAAAVRDALSGSAHHSG